MKRINYKSDFDFILSLATADGSSVGWPTWDWRLVLYARGQQSVTFEAGCKDGEPYGCFNDEGRIHVVCDGHGLGTGVLYGEFYADIPNAIYADGKELTVTPFPIGVTLIPGAGDEALEVEVANTIPIVYINAYQLAVEQGYTGTAEEYMRATLELVETVEAAQTTLEQSQAAAQNAAEASRIALQTAQGAEAVLNDCREATSEAHTATEGANTAGEYAETQGRRAEVAAKAAEELVADADVLAHTNRNNNFSTAQTVNGTLTINGDIVQNGEAYETHAEQVYTKKDLIITREGAEGGLGEGEVTGFKAKKYDGENDGLLVFNASGEARVGDEGDTQPLLTREEVSQLRDGDLLVWDAAKLRAVPLRKRIVDMEVTYEDDTTETFRVICEDESE